MSKKNDNIPAQAAPDTAPQAAPQPEVAPPAETAPAEEAVAAAAAEDVRLSVNMEQRHIIG